MTGNKKKFHLRRQDREIKDRVDIEQLMKKATVCHLALMDDDEPYAVPVSYGYEERAIYFHSALEGRKVDIIKRNNKVSFSIVIDEGIEFDGHKCKVRYKSVSGTGTARVLEDNLEKTKALKTIMWQCVGSEYSFEEERLSTTLVIRIDIDDVHGKQAGF